MPRRPRMFRSIPFLLLLFCLLPPPLAARQAGDREQAVPFHPIRFGDPAGTQAPEPFFPDASPDPAVPTPDSLLGQQLGTRLSHHAEILDCFHRWAEVSDRAEIGTYATTFEGRDLIRVVISSPANMARLEAIQAGLARLSDPEGLSPKEAESIVERTPAVAWLGYSIHGDELSGCDAALALGYHLISDRSAKTAALLDQVVVVIDPVMNPDGRERIISQVEQSAGYVANLDDESMQRGRWPWGRGNHYLFDMNRDWMVGANPETRGRWREIQAFHPQLMVDAHEMGSQDTYLFYPQSEPRNPNLPPALARWHKVFAADQARAFDARSWSYYTREWADAWAPFYSDAWGSLNGAVGILYEQAGTRGFPLRRASGKVLTYREAVHHHAVSSLANLKTLQAHREEILEDYLAERQARISRRAPGNSRQFILVPGTNRSRELTLLGLLQAQGIRIWKAPKPFTARNAVNRLGITPAHREFPAGSFLIPARQPQGALVKAGLAFDPHFDKKVLTEERRRLEQENASMMYDITAWSLGSAFDLDVWWSDSTTLEGASLQGPPGSWLEDRAGNGSAEDRTVAWIVDGSSDASVAFAARAMRAGLAVHQADRKFSAAGRTFPRGSLLVRRGENGEEVEGGVARAARDSGVRPFPVATGRSPDEGPDLGGQHFHLLSAPKIALLGNSPISPDTYGHVWFLLDHEIGVPFSILDVQTFGDYDLRRYNVLIVPPSRGGLSRTLSPHRDGLRTWVENGGTLIACGSSAAALCGKDFGLVGTRLRRDVLEDLESYQRAAKRERAARTIRVDEKTVWEPPKKPGQKPSKEEKKAPAADKEEDAWALRFSPPGVLLRGLVDTRHWITAGTGAEMAVFFAGSNVFLSKDPVRTPVRFAGEESLRLSGLLWPEARERIADSAWLTVEPVGNGQVVLFASMPGYRMIFRGTGRLLENAAIFGPGRGASQPTRW
ncbi:MAG: M14 metallopeptidase family protein [Planctomycetota bacterium]